MTLFWLSFCRLFSAWKIVGMTMTCNRCNGNAENMNALHGTGNEGQESHREAGPKFVPHCTREIGPPYYQRSHLLAVATAGLLLWNRAFCLF